MEKLEGVKVMDMVGGEIKRVEYAGDESRFDRNRAE